MPAPPRLGLRALVSNDKARLKLERTGGRGDHARWIVAGGDFFLNLMDQVIGMIGLGQESSHTQRDKLFLVCLDNRGAADHDALRGINPLDLATNLDTRAHR